MFDFMRFEWLDSIENVDRLSWDNLVGESVSPYHEWGFLHALETSQSVGRRTGWTPRYLVGKNENGDLVAAAPFYVKDHSHGEFVYDYGWADVASRLGVPYYPKLVATIPATPSADYRFLFAAESLRETLTPVMIDHAETKAHELGLTGVHYLFVHPEMEAALKIGGTRPEWIHHRYLWRNMDYADFESFGAAFNKNQRRNIRREREEVRQQNLTVMVRSLESLLALPPGELWVRWMWEYYDTHNEQYGPWAARYLTPEFFPSIAANLASRVLFVTAHSSDADPCLDRPVAMAMLFHKNEWLFGRYWGADRFYPSLHFEVCYYAPIEWAITHGVRFFDPGAGSPHKIRRGFEAVQTSSYHRYFDPGFSTVFERYIPDINDQECEQIRVLNADSPLKRNGIVLKDPTGQ